MMQIVKNKWFWIVLGIIVLTIIIKIAFGRSKPKKLKINGYLPEGWSAEVDARRLHEAMDGLGTDEDTIWLVLDNKSAAQLAAIYNAYIELYGVSIIEDFEGDLSGDDLNRALSYFSGILN